MLFVFVNGNIIRGLKAKIIWHFKYYKAEEVILGKKMKVGLNYLLNIRSKFQKVSLHISPDTSFLDQTTGLV